jgi:hypothetical protein
MKRDAGGPCLSAVFVDYDNIYMSLKRKSEEAAKRFAKDAGVWLRAIENGRIITATNTPFNDSQRRIVMNRCYGNPVPRRNAHDNSTDMNSFPFVRHHFLRAGFEVIDCPPLTAQLKNSSDIRMVMDVRDLLTHDTYFDEFIILSGDADFTPVLHRLRAHARRTVIFANDFTAAPYTAISDGEVREADLITLILNGELLANEADGETLAAAPSTAKLEAARGEIMAEVVAGVRSSGAPVPLEALADRAVRALGHDKTVATGWAGAGSFRELLRQSLPAEVRISAEPPFMAYDPRRHGERNPPTALLARDIPDDMIQSEGPHLSAQPGTADPSPALRDPLAAAQRPAGTVPHPVPGMSQPPAARGTAPTQSAGPSSASAGPTTIQQSIARIHEACQAPPMAPHEYRLLFEIMAKEINENDLIGAQTLVNITQRAQERGLDVRRDDVRFILEVVSEADPWFEQGASANLFAGRFRNFVVARCRGQGLNLSADELDLIDAWFAGGTLPQTQAPVATRAGAAQGHASTPPSQSTQSAPQAPLAPAQHASSLPVQAAQPAMEAPRPPAQSGSRRRTKEANRPPATERPAANPPAADTPEDFPRIVRTRLRG